MEPLIHIIDAETKPERIDRVLSSQFSQSRTYFQQIIAQQAVTVNGISAIKPSFVVKPGDRIEIFFPAIRPLGALPLPAEDMGASILFTHDDFYIVYKPAGLITHAPGKDSEIVTLVDWLVHTSAELTAVGQPERPGIVHRLDKDTSGIIVIPRNNVAHAHFSGMFQQRLIEKTYLAIVQGHPKERGTIDYPIGRDYKQMHKMTHQPHVGRDAATHYEVIEYLEDAALLAVRPVTGRTHQIRVHMAAIGHPILGDAVYGQSHSLISRQALHAHQLSFIYKDQQISCWHDMPADMRTLVEQLREK
jgi:23S rRNA pseudouridine1911/1915/1917 synthase